MALQAIIKKSGDAVLLSGTDVLMSGEKTVELSCYTKVETVVVSKAHAVANVSFSYTDGMFFKNYEYPFVIDGDNPIAQAYYHLKTLPEFSDATDC